MTGTRLTEPTVSDATRRPTRRLPPWWPLALFLVLGAVCGWGYGTLKPPQYTASSYVVVVPEKGTDPTIALGFAQAYGRVTTGGTVLSRAQDKAGLPVAALRGSVRATTSPDAPMIEITGTSARADRAARIANAVAWALAANGNDSARATGVRLMLFSRALVPVAPTSPSAPIALAVGACAGGLVGALVLLTRPRAGAGASVVPGVPAPASGAPPRPGTVPDRRATAKGGMR